LLRVALIAGQGFQVKEIAPTPAVSYSRQNRKEHDKNVKKDSINQ
jgi:hypothetical protein